MGREVGLGSEEREGDAEAATGSVRETWGSGTEEWCPRRPTASEHPTWTDQAGRVKETRLEVPETSCAYRWSSVACLGM